MCGVVEGVSSVYTIGCDNVEGSSVTITQDGQYLTLCEVKVLGTYYVIVRAILMCFCVIIYVYDDNCFKSRTATNKPARMLKSLPSGTPTLDLGDLLNIAEEGTASQSSTGWNGVPGRAIDGDISMRYKRYVAMFRLPALLDGLKIMTCRHETEQKSTN